jgi:hypothetical protein
MLARKNNHRQSIFSFLQGRASTATMSSRGFCIASLALSICGAAALPLRAQTLKVQKSPTPCQDALKPGSPASAGQAKTTNIADGTKSALVREWLDPKGVDHALRAFQLLAISVPSPDVALEVLNQLDAGDSNPVDQGFYLAAMGNPGKDGPRNPGLPNFLDILAKANNLHKEMPKDAGQVFGCTEELIDNIFTKPGTLTPEQEVKLENFPGPAVLAIINDSFSRKDNYVALYQLLDAYPENTQNYGDNLEIFRAAFEMDADSLAKQVAAKINAPKN